MDEEYKDYYRILGVDRQANRRVIKAAYRRRIRRYRPLRYPDDPLMRKRVRELKEAYAILSDRVLRQEYDHIVVPSMQQGYEQVVSPVVLMRRRKGTLNRLRQALRSAGVLFVTTVRRMHPRRHVAQREAWAMTRAVYYARDAGVRVGRRTYIAPVPPHPAPPAQRPRRLGSGARWAVLVSSLLVVVFLQLWLSHAIPWGYGATQHHAPAAPTTPSHSTLFGTCVRNCGK